MSLSKLVKYAIDKKRFLTLSNYIDFCTQYLEYIEGHLQARIISQKESHYEFFQYKKEGGFSITRPINSLLMYNAQDFSLAAKQFKETIRQLKEREQPSDELRSNLVRTIYTIQQSIGATLDALPAGKSNQARKVNGDLFERLICLLITSVDVTCISGSVQVPVKDDDGIELLKTGYQHDLLISKDGELKIIGSVKTSSKDRIDKIFMDKFLYSKLTNTALPHIAIFLNDVQRKNTRKENRYGISATFLPGHFKTYTVKLNPLDGVYYCDIRPNMISDAFLAKYIKTIDHFFYSDLLELLNTRGQTLDEIIIDPNDTEDGVQG